MAHTDKQFEIENDARTLIEAERIKLDKKRMTAARNHIKNDLKATQAAAGKS